MTAEQALPDGVRIRALGPGDDRDAYLDLTARAFGAAAGTQGAWERTLPVIADGRCLGAFAGSQLVGSALFHDMRQWWLGRAVPMAGVAGVKVAPEWQGRGIGRALMSALLGEIAARGYPLSALYPATMPIYRSLGWELAGGIYEAVIPARSLRSFVPPGVPDEPGAGRSRPGRLRRAVPGDADEVLSVIGRVHEAARDCGPVTRAPGAVRRWLAEPELYTYLADDGFLAYRWHRGNEEIFVERAVAVSAQTLRALWAVVASHASIAPAVRALAGPADPLWWLTREPDAKLSHRASHGMWMLRVVDAPAAIAARGFPAAAELAIRLRLSDDSRTGNAGLWELAVGGGKGSLTPCRAASRPAGGNTGNRPPGGGPLTLGARGFAALYAGTPLATLRRAGLAAAGDPDADGAVDAVFAARAFMLDSF